MVQIVLMNVVVRMVPAVMPKMVPVFVLLDSTEQLVLKVSVFKCKPLIICSLSLWTVWH